MQADDEVRVDLRLDALFSPTQLSERELEPIRVYLPELLKELFWAQQSNEE